jgi:hypothetical protein
MAANAPHNDHHRAAGLCDDVALRARVSAKPFMLLEPVGFHRREDRRRFPGSTEQQPRCEEGGVLRSIPHLSNLVEVKTCIVSFILFLISALRLTIS